LKQIGRSAGNGGGNGGEPTDPKNYEGIAEWPFNLSTRFDFVASALM
jgi:hypothetical protein